jgi:hypothetical protein
MIKDFTKKKYVHIANKNLEAKDGTTIIVPLSFWHILEKINSLCCKNKYIPKFLKLRWGEKNVK